MFDAGAFPVVQVLPVSCVVVPFLPEVSEAGLVVEKNHVLVPAACLGLVMLASWRVMSTAVESAGELRLVATAESAFQVSACEVEVWGRTSLLSFQHG